MRLPTTRPASQPPPVRWLIALLVALLLGLGGTVHWVSVPFIRSTPALRIPGTRGIHAAYLPGGKGRAGLTIGEVAKLDGEGAFVPLPPPESARVLNRDFGGERWYRITFENPEPAPRQVVLDLIWRIYDEGALYRRLPDGQWSETLSGGCVSPWDPRNSPRWRAFELTLPAQQPLTVYLHVRDYYRLPTKFLYWPNLDDFLKWERFMFAEYFGYFCLWMGMVAYGLFLYAMLRERAQLHCVLFATLLGALALTSGSMTTLFVPWPEFPLGDLLQGVFCALALLNLCLFARHFINTPTEDPALDRWLRRLQRVLWGSLFTLPIALWPPFALNYRQAFAALAVISMGGLLWAGVRRWRAGCSQAPFFLLAFSPYLVGMTVWMFYAHDTIVRDDEQRLISLVGNALSLIFLSFAAAYRHRLALEENCRLQSSYTDSLEREVADRTHVLQDLSDRLAVAVTERDRVMAIIGHDLRGPAISLGSLTRLLANGAPSFTREGLADLADEISQACDLQLELLNNLLIWGSMHSGTWRPHPVEVAVHQAVESVWQMLKDLACTKRLLFRNAIPADLAVRADRHLLETVLRNLLANAIKFTEPGGRIEVEALLPGDRSIEIRVKDDGVGIPADRLATLFGSGVKSTAGTQGEKGTGIGLNLSRDLALSAGGGLRVESAPGVGTTVFFTLPVC